MNGEDLEKIKEATEEFLTNMAVGGFEVKISGQDDGGVDIAIALAQEPQFLIGQEGKTLLDVQHIVRMIINKKLGAPVRIKVDINGYQEKKVQQLKKMARETADQVALTGLAKTLPPMSSYERRIVHAELAGRSDVLTQSQGEGLERCVAVIAK